MSIMQEGIRILSATYQPFLCCHRVLSPHTRVQDCSFVHNMGRDGGSGWDGREERGERE